MRWDIFCKVIDNHGDIGVCWRLAVQLARRGQAVGLWVDLPDALRWMAPAGEPGVQVHAWAPGTGPADPGDVVIEAFGCELGEAVAEGIARRMAAGRPPAWLNLEYLTAEGFARRNHGLRSPVLSGPAAGAPKHFFYPGFTEGTGGLLREEDLAQQQAGFDRGAWLASAGIAAGRHELLASLFCYEPAGLPELLAQLAQAGRPVRLLVTAGRATAAVDAALLALPDPGRVAVERLPLLTQHDYDRLLWACDLNYVRGEDSLVRALWAGAPMVWQPYPQDDGAHRTKLLAWLDWLQAPASLRSHHLCWSGLQPPPLLTWDLPAWSACVAAARARLLAQDDLVTQLIRFVGDAGRPHAKSG